VLASDVVLELRHARNVILLLEHLSQPLDLLLYSARSALSRFQLAILRCYQGILLLDRLAELAFLLLELGKGAFEALNEQRELPFEALVGLEPLVDLGAELGSRVLCQRLPRLRSVAALHNCDVQRLG
jgi:hypothetical protein